MFGRADCARARETLMIARPPLDKDDKRRSGPRVTQDGEVRRSGELRPSKGMAAQSLASHPSLPRIAGPRRGRRVALLVGGAIAVGVIGVFLVVNDETKESRPPPEGEAAPRTPEGTATAYRAPATTEESATSRPTAGGAARAIAA